MSLMEAIHTPTMTCPLLDGMTNCSVHMHFFYPSDYINDPSDYINDAQLITRF